MITDMDRLRRWGDVAFHSLNVISHNGADETERIRQLERIRNHADFMLGALEVKSWRKPARPAEERV